MCFCMDRSACSMLLPGGSFHGLAALCDNSRMCNSSVQNLHQAQLHVCWHMQKHVGATALSVIMTGVDMLTSPCLMPDKPAGHDQESTWLQVMRTSPYGVHTDYIFGGLTAKRNRLREAQIWLDAPSYYSSPRLLQVPRTQQLSTSRTLRRSPPAALHALLAAGAGLRPSQDHPCCAGGHPRAGSAGQLRAPAQRLHGGAPPEGHAAPAGPGHPWPPARLPTSLCLSPW